MLNTFLAFILGLGLPFVALLCCVKPTRSLNVYLPLISVICFGAMLFFYDPNDKSIFYILTALLGINITLWLSFISSTIVQKPSLISRLVFLVALLSAIVVLYLLFPNDNLILYWGGLLVCITAFQGFYLQRIQSELMLGFNVFTSLFIALTLSNIMFIVWGYTPAGMVELLLGIAFFSAALLLTFWIALKDMLFNHFTGKLPFQSNGNYPEYYTPDSVTNIPSSQQAIHTFQNTLAKNADSRYAVISFKPINFAQVNTVLGHHNSDMLLLQFAYGLQKVVENHEHLVNFSFHPQHQPQRIARLQGLNFMVIMNVASSAHSDTSLISELCELLKKSIPQAMSFKSYSLNFDLIFGVSISGKHGDSAAELIAHSEDALLYGEENHLKMAFFDTDLSLYNQEQLLKMEQLKADVDSNNLHFFIQPQVNLHTKTVMGFELKTHWYNQTETPLGIEDFIILAECSGEIYRLTQMMLEQAFIAIEQFKVLKLEKPISIKLISKMLFETDVVDLIEQKLHQYQVKGEQLIIELPEDTLNDPDDNTLRFVDQLKALSVGVSIANFSGSYEGLKYLRKLSVNQVKIDCSLLSASTENDTEKAIINALINLCRTMAVPIIGHNIQTSPSAKAYLEMGGEVVQGGVISSGVVLDELEIWLNNWKDRYQH